MTPHVDLNCDLGESFGRWQLGADERVMDFITSANVACGFHAGDPATIRRTVALARRKGVAVGAHPGLPDLAGFGRRELDLTPDEAYETTLYQVGALAALARASGLRLQHLKPHGALYTMAARRPELAEALVAAARDFREDLIFVGLPYSAMERAAEAARVPFAAELFADRTYQPDGTLTSRRSADALVKDPLEAAERVVTMVQEGRVQAVGGEWLSIRADTVCIHGDTPGALALAEAIRTALAGAGIAVVALGAGVP